MKYLVNNTSDRRITLVGRFHMDIPPFAQGIEMDLTEGTASRLARVYPVLQFQKKEVEEAPAASKVSLEVFSENAKVKGLGTGRVIVVYDNKRYKVESDTNTEEALREAFEQYSNA